MAEYYARRAPEFERVYEKPERQADLERLRALVVDHLTDHDVLEIACGTGYWTEVASRSARSIVAADCNEPMLALARAKAYGCPVRFVEADAYDLAGLDGRWSAALAGFWWSHVPRARLDGFLGRVRTTLATGGDLVVFDNRYVEGSSSAVGWTTADGDTYQARRLADGSRHDVLKNFPTPEDIRAAVEPHAEACEIGELEYYWWCRCTLRPADGMA